MKQAVLLHTIADAEHYLEHDIDLFKDALVFSANIHVVSFLKSRHKCVDLCAYVTLQEIQQIQAAAIRDNFILLEKLDEKLTPEINRYLGLSIRYFEPLYSFTGARQLVLFALLELMLRRMLEQEQFERIVTYESKIGPLQSLLNEFLSELFPTIRIVTVRYTSPEQLEKTTIHGVKLNQMPELLVTASGKTAGPIQYIRQNGTNGRHILLFEPFNKLDFLEQQAKAATMHIFQSQPNEVKREFDYRLNPNILPAWDELDIHGIDVYRLKRLKLLYQAIGQHFCSYFIQYLQVLSLYRQLHAELFLEQVYWECPPFSAAGALVLEYLLHDTRVQVIGIQSAVTALLGKIAAPYAPASVFSRCNQFITYDATLEEALKTLPENSSKIPAFIIKEQPNSKPPERKREAIDIAVYLSPSMNFLETGQICTHVHTQIELLSFLETLTDKQIHVITHPYATQNNCAVLHILKKLQHVKWLREFTHEDYLTEYAPKLILLDTVNFMVEELAEEKYELVIFAKGMNLSGKQPAKLTYVHSVEEFKKLI